MAAMVLPRGPVGAGNLLWRTAKPKLGGGLGRKIPGQVGALRTAAPLFGVGVVHVLLGFNAAAALEGGDRVGREYALISSNDLLSFCSSIALTLPFSQQPSWPVLGSL